MSINAHTIPLGLLGWPVSHSLSPAMHNAALQALNLNYVYLPLPTPPQQLAAALAGLPALGFRGVNVTIPHKQTVIPHLDTLTPGAQALGAVNSIIIDENGRLHGDNTDWQGFLRSLPASYHTSTNTKQPAIVLGAGGSARAIVYALAQQNHPIHILARRPEQAQQLITHLRPHLPHATLHAYHLKQLPDLVTPPPPLTSPKSASHPNQAPHPHIKTALHPHPPQPTTSPPQQSPTTPRPTSSPPPSSSPLGPLIINTTPLGMTPHTTTSIWPADLPWPPHALAIDLVYNPATTQFMRQAQAANCTTINGLPMLLHQGAISFEQWTGHSPPLHVMSAALNA
ncbi:MAG TPA: shikimate dehydrogenase [Anaerolineae bacterium]|nr:shikimate dehydrogenase [Anaerolineae bacterium]